MAVEPSAESCKKINEVGKGQGVRDSRGSKRAAELEGIWKKAETSAKAAADEAFARMNEWAAKMEESLRAPGKDPIQWKREIEQRGEEARIAEKWADIAERNCKKAELIRTERLIREVKGDAPMTMGVLAQLLAKIPTEDAQQWWPRISSQLEDPNPSFEEFRNEFIDKYISREERTMKRAEYLLVHQGELTVKQYESEFTRLQVFAKREGWKEELQWARFVRGLRKEIREHINLGEMKSFSEIVNKALMVEAQGHKGGCKNEFCVLCHE